MKKGIDISKWQGDIDFKKVATQVDFVILREGYRKTIDPKFVEYAAGCKANKIDIHGVYHFIYATNAQAAREEALSAIGNLQKAGLPPTTRIWADFEYDSIDQAKKANINLSKAEINEITVAFCEALVINGYNTGIYTNIDFYKNYYTKATLTKYPIWLADYSGGPDFDCIMQQYSSSGKVLGISGNVDMNYCYCDDNTAQDDRWKIEKAVASAEAIARDDSHGYDQVDRWGNPDYDCSGLILRCLEEAGIPAKSSGASYTGNMNQVLTKIGFTDVIGSVDLKTGAGMLRGDVLLNSGSHTAFYCGNGQLVHASINEKGGITGGKSGDQTGKEICIRSYYNKPWNHVLRYKGGAVAPDPVRTWLQKGDAGDAVKEMQKMLIACGFGCGATGIDGSFGPATDSALKAFQAFYGLEVDGFYGPASKAKLTSVYNNKVSAQAPVVATNSPSYTVGKEYVLQVELKVRKGAGTSYAAKRHSELTADGQKHDKDKDGCLDAGTKITCQVIQKVGNDIWIKAPSGWMAAYFNGRTYIK